MQSCLIILQLPDQILIGTVSRTNGVDLERHENRGGTRNFASCGRLDKYRSTDDCNGARQLSMYYPVRDISIGLLMRFQNVMPKIFPEFGVRDTSEILHSSGGLL
jgi:hypothetical protein